MTFIAQTDGVTSIGTVNVSVANLSSTKYLR